VDLVYPIGAIVVRSDGISRYFQSRAGKGFITFAASCALLAAAVGYGFYHSSVRGFLTSTGEQKITALRLVDAFYATYTETRTDFMTGDAPVPASFRAHAIERYNQGRESGDSFRLVMVGPERREIVTPPGDSVTADTIRRFSKASNPAPVTAYFKSGDETLLRTIYPSIASQQSCVDCHNQLHPERTQWKLNDVIGAFVLSVRADTFLHRALQEAIGVGLFIFLTATAIGFIFSLLHYRYLVRRAETEKELVAAKIAAEAANISKSQFLATMSHELRTPLNSILGFSEIIAGEAIGPVGNRKYRDYAADIHGSGEHLLAIINDILDMSKIEAGQLTLYEDAIDIPTMLDSCCRFVQQRADEAHITMASNVPVGLPGLVADELRLKQIMLNLLSNAVKFTPKNGCVTVGAMLNANGGIELWVADSGLGMTAEEIVIALQPFRQVDNSLHRSRDGTGLGLPLTKNLIELHGGTMTIQSTPGEGTTVHVFLPEKRILREAPARRIA
jgi:signal transduction histidine kinase